MSVGGLVPLGGGIDRVILKGTDATCILAKSDSGVVRAQTDGQRPPLNCLWRGRRSRIGFRQILRMPKASAYIMGRSRCLTDPHLCTKSQEREVGHRADGCAKRRFQIAFRVRRSRFPCFPWWNPPPSLSAKVLPRTPRDPRLKQEVIAVNYSDASTKCQFVSGHLRK